MSVHHCPDCRSRTDRANCPTCKGSAYVHRNSQGRITHPATSQEFSTWIMQGKRPGPRPSPQGYRR